MAVYKLRLQTPAGPILIDTLSKHNTFQELADHLAVLYQLDSVSNYKLVTRIPPPKSFKLGDHDVKNKLLGDHFQSGDMIILQVPESDHRYFDVLDRLEPAAKKSNKGNSAYGSSNVVTMSSIENTAENDTTVKIDHDRTLRRFQVAANNSCFFLSVQYCLTGNYQEDTGTELRRAVAEYISHNPARYPAGTLENGRTPKEYATWIRKPESWGGAIEIGIISELHSICIRVVNIKEAAFMPMGNEHYRECIYLRFDGVHYDALIAETGGGKKITRFLTDDHAVQLAVLKYGEKEKEKSAFVDTTNMKYQCSDCSAYLKDPGQMSAHRKNTGHKNFNQVQ